MRLAQFVYVGQSHVLRKAKKALKQRPILLRTLAPSITCCTQVDRRRDRDEQLFIYGSVSSLLTLLLCSRELSDYCLLVSSTYS